MAKAAVVMVTAVVMVAVARVVIIPRQFKQDSGTLV